MKTKDYKLKRCRKCHSKDLKLKNCGYNTFNCGSVQCVKCGHKVQADGLDTDAEIAAVWNKDKPSSHEQLKFDNKKLRERLKNYVLALELEKKIHSRTPPDIGTLTPTPEMNEALKRGDCQALYLWAVENHCHLEEAMQCLDLYRKFHTATMNLETAQGIYNAFLETPDFKILEGDERDEAWVKAGRPVNEAEMQLKIIQETIMQETLNGKSLGQVFIFGASADKPEFKDTAPIHSTCLVSAVAVSVEEYYLQDTREIIGNCMLFWRLGGGYTCHLKDAEKFSKEAALAQEKSRRSDRAFKCSDIDAIADPQVDVQYASQLIEQAEVRRNS